MKKVVDRILHPHHSHHTDSKHGSIDGVDSSGMIVHRKVEAPTEETVVRPTIVEELPVEEEVIEVQPVIHRVIEVPEVHHIERHVYEKVLPTEPTVITKEPIIDVTIQPHIVEEVRTIVHREVPETYVVHKEQHIHEHQTRPTIHTAAVYNDVTPIEATTVDSHLRAIAEPHERKPPSNISSNHNIANIANEVTWRAASPRAKWVAAYPKAMLRLHEGEHSHKGIAHTQSGHIDTKLKEHTDKNDKVLKASKLSEKAEKNEATGKQEKVQKEPTKQWSSIKSEVKEKLQDTPTENDASKLDNKQEKWKGKEKIRGYNDEKGENTKVIDEDSSSSVSKQALLDANSPDNAHAQDSGPSLDHPVFVYREPEHSSLDIRAQFSLERMADLQTQNAFGDLPGFSGKPHISVDRGHEDLERGSKIGLDSPTQYHTPLTSTATTHQKQTEQLQEPPTLKPEKEKPTPTKLERELRKQNTDLAGAFVVSTLKPEH